MIKRDKIILSVIFLLLVVFFIYVLLKKDNQITTEDKNIKNSNTGNVLLGTGVTETLSNSGVIETSSGIEENNEDKQKQIEEEALRLAKEKEARVLKIKEIKERKDREFYQKALNSKDIKICEEIIAESLKNTCKDNFVVTTTQTILDEKLCDNLLDENEKNLCKDNMLQKNLVNSVKGDLIGNNSNKEEVQNINKTSFESKLELCTKMSSDVRALECKNNLYYEKALEDINGELCNEIKGNEYTFSKCIKMVIRSERRSKR